LQQLQQTIKNKWHYTLHKLFDYPSIVLIGGRWKTGKTDFALFIAETLLKLPFGQGGGTMISEVASNIKTNNPNFKYIYDLVSLRNWLYETKCRKLYIFDEASEHLPSRRAMTTKTVSFIQLIPEISKAHARMIVIGHQLLTIDKTFLDDVWCRGVFLKIQLKKAQLFSSLLIHPYVFSNIPRTSISFDPYAIAPFQETASGSLIFKEEDKQLVWRWLNGETYKELGLHNMTLHRKVQKLLRFYMENELHITHT
jgi:hypothetical protein